MQSRQFLRLKQLELGKICSVAATLLHFMASHVVAAATPQPVSVEELSQALKQYRSLEGLDVAFKQTKTLKDMDIKLHSDGHLSLSLPDKVEWKILKPTPLTVVLEKEKITINSASGSQVFSQAENPSAKDRQGFLTLLTWLKLDATEISEKYRVTKTGPRQFRFEAKNPQEPVLKALEMKLATSGYVSELFFHEVSGDDVTIIFGKPKVRYHAKK